LQAFIVNNFESSVTAVFEKTKSKERVHVKQLLKPLPYIWTVLYSAWFTWFWSWLPSSIFITSWTKPKRCYILVRSDLVTASGNETKL